MTAGAGYISLLHIPVAQGRLGSRDETARGVLAGVISLLVAIAVVACLAPARRAAAINPMHALRLD